MTLHRIALPHLLRFTSGVVLTGLMLLVSAYAQQVTRHPGARPTVATLNAAWNLENNELWRALAFEQKAEQEGYAPVASLFRAAAAAERIHLRNLTLAMKKLGYVPDAAAEQPEVGSTGDNLRAEMAAHANYRDTVLPALIARARHDGVNAAIRSLCDALRTEESLAKYYTTASAHLDASQGKPRQTYYVCSACGYMTTNLNFHVCRVCYHFREKHEAVS